MAAPPANSSRGRTRIPPVTGPDPCPTIIGNCPACPGRIPIRQDGRLAEHKHWPAGFPEAFKCRGTGAQPRPPDVQHYGEQKGGPASWRLPGRDTKERGSLMPRERTNGNDRTIHAVTEDGREIVRYNRAGKWWAEAPPDYRQRLSLREAARLATLRGSAVRLGLAGGSQFDAAVRDRLGG